MALRPRIGLIGCGRIGLVHLRTLLAHPECCELAAIVDANPETVDKISADFRIATISTDIGSVFDDPTIDAVVIASSTETHAPYIAEAARTGTAAFTEKPIALDLESTDRALDAVTRAGIQLQVGFQRRFDTAYANARQLIDDGELGDLEMIRDAMRDPGPPPLAYLEKSGGLYRDMTIHNFDCVRWLKGQDPVTLHAVASAIASDTVRAVGDVDTSIVTMQFADGSLASIENSRRSGFGYDVRTEVFGSRGAIMIGDSRETPARRFDAAGVHEDHQHFFLNRFKSAYEAELLAFIEAVANGTDVPVSGAHGRAAMVLAYAAEASLREGRPVRIDDVSSHATQRTASRA